jgi:hypothetical protein
MKKSATRPVDQRDLLLQIVEEAYRLPTWNGTNLRASLQRIPWNAAAWRPPRGRRSIADIVAHCAYWKYAIARGLSDGPRGSFPLKGSNWVRLNQPFDTDAWKSLLDLLDQQHARLCEAIREYPSRLALNHAAGQKAVRKIFGLAIHDAYHTGQVHLIKKMWKRDQTK